MTPKEAFEIYKMLPDDQRERVLEIIGQMSIEATRWRLVEAVQLLHKELAVTRRDDEQVTRH